MSYQDQMALLQEKRRELRALEAQAERAAKAMQPITIEDETKMVAAQGRRAATDLLISSLRGLAAATAEPTQADKCRAEERQRGGLWYNSIRNGGYRESDLRKSWTLGC